MQIDRSVASPANQSRGENSWGPLSENKNVLRPSVTKKKVDNMKNETSFQNKVTVYRNSEREVDL